MAQLHRPLFVLGTLLAASSGMQSPAGGWFACRGCSQSRNPDSSFSSSSAHVSRASSPLKAIPTLDHVQPRQQQIQQDHRLRGGLGYPAKSTPSRASSQLAKSILHTAKSKLGCGRSKSTDAESEPLTAMKDKAPSQFPPPATRLSHEQLVFIQPPPIPKSLFDRPVDSLLQASIMCVDENVERNAGCRAYRRPGIDEPCCGQDEESHNKNIESVQHYAKTSTKLAQFVVAAATIYLDSGMPGAGSALHIIISPTTQGISWITRAVLERQKFVVDPAQHAREASRHRAEEMFKELLNSADRGSAILVIADDLGTAIVEAIKRSMITDNREAGTIVGIDASHARQAMLERGATLNSFDVLEQRPEGAQPNESSNNADGWSSLRDRSGRDCCG